MKNLYTAAENLATQAGKVYKRCLSIYPYPRSESLNAGEKWSGVEDSVGQGNPVSGSDKNNDSKH